VGVIARQSDRLQALVDDLLSLARIEEDTEQLRVSLEPRVVAEVLHAAVEACGARAQQHDVGIELDVPDDLRAPMNAPLIEQAVVNLLDNAIKYGGDGSTVRVSAAEVEGDAEDGGGVVIGVTDEGPGIAPEHQARIFRTDKARSRRLGGTGLGLSIVRHIALAHGGYASVESVPNAGSTFRIHLPAGG
jgi:two-component system phosphate regulon sensor histidine kinase PhoR